MPSGYTEKLSKGPQEFQDFALECARAFGALISMRDADGAEIPSSFEPNPYYKKAEQEARERLVALERRTSTEWAEAEIAEREEHNARNTELRAKASEKLDRYRSMRQEVLDWTPPTGEHIEMKAFMLDQLDQSIKMDCSTTWIRDREPMSVAQYRAEQLVAVQKEVGRAATGWAEEQERAASRTQWVADLRESLGVTV